MTPLVLPVVLALSGDVSVTGADLHRAPAPAHVRLLAQGWRGGPTQAPPPPVFERHAARRGWVWVGGRYQWEGGRYVWIGGHWERERSGWIWQPGRWDWQGNHYVWIEGQWVA